MVIVSDYITSHQIKVLFFVQQKNAMFATYLNRYELFQMAVHTMPDNYMFI